VRHTCSTILHHLPILLKAATMRVSSESRGDCHQDSTSGELEWVPKTIFCVNKNAPQTRNQARIRQRDERNYEKAKDLNERGNTFFRNQQYDEAMEIYERSLKYTTLRNENIRDTEENELLRVVRSATLHNVGVIYYLRGNHKKAIAVFKNALRCSRISDQTNVKPKKWAAAFQPPKQFTTDLNVISTVRTFHKMHLERGEIEEARLLSNEFQFFLG
jgi:tetratricopeptide (TPR) repeat protein